MAVLGDLTGDAVLFRYVSQGRVGGAYPTYRVETEDSSVLALYRPHDSRYIRTAPSAGDAVREKLDGSWQVVERVSPNRSLILWRVGAWFSVWLLWTPEWEFGGSYVNFEEPWHETPRGYDTNDLAIDVTVMPGGAWSWKDREEFDALVEAGAITSSAATSVLAAADQVISDIGAGSGLFDPGLRQWRSKEEGLPPPVLPADWAHL